MSNQRYSPEFKDETARQIVDRLVRLINKLDQETEVSLQLAPRNPDSDAALHP